MVIFADKIFTAPSVLLQLFTGIWLSELTGRTFSEWFWAVIGVSLLVFVLWVKAAFIQIRLDKILTKSGEVNEEFHKQMRIWFWLGVPSFVGSMYIYYLMVFKNFP
jgi:uncharacterized membrane protein